MVYLGSALPIAQRALIEFRQQCSEPLSLGLDIVLCDNVRMQVLFSTVATSAVNHAFFL